MIRTWGSTLTRPSFLLYSALSLFDCVSPQQDCPPPVTVLLPSNNFFHIPLSKPTPPPSALHQSCSSILPELTPSPPFFFFSCCTSLCLSVPLTSDPDVDTRGTPPQTMQKDDATHKNSAFPPVNVPTFVFSARTYIHHPFFGLGCCLLHASFGLLCGGHHPFLGHREPLHQYIHLERRDGWTPLLQTGRPGWCSRWMCRREDVSVRLCEYECVCVLLVAPLPIGGSTEGWEDCTTGLQHADWETEGGENSNYARDGEEEEEEEDAAAFSSHAATPPLKHPSTLIHLSPDDAHSCSAQPLACCLHIVIGLMLSLWALLHNQ